MLFTDAIAIHLRTSCNFTAVQYMPIRRNPCETLVYHLANPSDITELKQVRQWFQNIY
jgi:hypothetical protein